MNSRRLSLLAMISVALSAHSIWAIAQNRSKNAPLPWPSDIRTIAMDAQRQGQPLLLMVSLPGCPWCELLRRNYLGLMRRNEGVVAFEFMINEHKERFVDFQGQRITPAAWSEAMKVKTTPTVFFFNAQAQEVAPRIEGIASADLIGAILDERLATARNHIQATRDASVTRAAVIR